MEHWPETIAKLFNDLRSLTLLPCTRDARDCKEHGLRLPDLWREIVNPLRTSEGKKKNPPPLVAYEPYLTHLIGDTSGVYIVSLDLKVVDRHNENVRVLLNHYIFQPLSSTHGQCRRRRKFDATDWKRVGRRNHA